MVGSLNFVSIPKRHGKRYMIGFKCLHLLNLNDIFLHSGIINLIKSLKINLKDGNYMILSLNSKEWVLTLWSILKRL
jgi:hypothetical protein